MKITNNIKWISFLVALFFLGGCIEEGKDEISGKGTNRFRFAAEEFSIVTFKSDEVSTSALLTIYRDAVSSGSMNESVTIQLELNADSLAKFNTDNDTDFVMLDPDAYTLNISPGTLTFAPGESAKTIIITFNPLVLDLGLKHVLPFVIKNPSGSFGVNERLNFAVVQTLPINKYDGIYEVTGDPWTDVVVPTITDFYPFDWHAETTGENSVVFWDPYFETYYHPISSGGSQSAYGSFGVEIEIDPSTGKITGMTNPWGSPAGNTRDVRYDPNDGINMWHSEDGSIDLKYQMTQSSLVPDPPHIRTSFNEHMEYVGPR